MSFFPHKNMVVAIFGKAKIGTSKKSGKFFGGIIWSSYDGKMWHHGFCGFRSTCGFGEDAWEIGSLFSSTPNHPSSQSGYMIQDAMIMLSDRYCIVNKDG